MLLTTIASFSFWFEGLLVKIHKDNYFEILNFNSVEKMLKTFVFSLLLLVISHGAIAAERILRVHALNSPKSIDPIYLSTVGENTIGIQLFEGLYTFDANGEVVLGQAASVKVEHGGLRHVFTLRSDIRWSNGDPVTAHDFMLTYKRLFNPANNKYSKPIYLFSDIKNARAISEGDLPISSLGVRAVDDKTLIIELERPIAYFSQLLTYAPFAPTPSAVYQQHGESWISRDALVTNGAYLVESAKINDKELHQSFVLRKNPKYYLAEDVGYEQVVLLFDSRRDQIALFAEGELDLILHYFGQRMSWVTEAFNAKVLRGPQIYTVYTAFNLGNESVKDVRVRKALALALDVERVAPRIDPLANPANSFSTPNIRSGWLPQKRSYASWSMKRRIEEAEKLLDQAGYSAENPLAIKLSSIDSAVGERISEALKEAWGGVGVSVEVVSLPSGELYQKMSEDDFQVARASWVQDTPDPADFISLLKTGHVKNYANWSNAEYDVILDKAVRENDLEQRNVYYRQLEKIIADQVPLLPVYHGAYATLVREGLTDVALTPASVVLRHVRLGNSASK